jgi:hypothetical protein
MRPATVMVARLDYRTGDNTEGLGVHTGIRYHW